MYNETEHKGKEVQLNKPTQGDVKKYKVFVKDPSTGNVKKVNFGDPNMEIKRDDPKRRKSFRARHKCDTAKDKTTPRYWSCKFWSKKNVSDLLKEVIEPENIDTTTLKIHDNLNPHIWGDNDILLDDVRKILLKNAKSFIEYCDIESLKFKDIIFTGSMANYNYTKFSDIDVHIVMDFNQISLNKEFVNEFFKIKKELWSDRLQIKVKGHDVEMYIQDLPIEHHSTGVYSLVKNEWLLKPTKKIINIDVETIKDKTSEFMNAIDNIEKIKNNDIFIEKYKILKEKISNSRQSGLEMGGEYSPENLSFKLLRNSGYLEKLWNMKNEYLTNKLSLDEILNPNQ